MAVKLPNPIYPTLSLGLRGYFANRGGSGDSVLSDLSQRSGDSAALGTVSWANDGTFGYVPAIDSYELIDLGGGGELCPCQATNGANAIAFDGAGLSLSAWINPARVTGTQTIISSEKPATTSGGYLWILNNNKLKLYIFDSGWRTIESNGTISAAWHHVAATWNAATKAMTLYIDGSADAATGSTSASWIQYGAAKAYNSYLGYYANQGGFRWLGGNITDVGVWSRALTSTEVGYLYNVRHAAVAQTPVSACFGGRMSRR